MWRYDRAALLGKSMQKRKMTPWIPAPTGGEQSRARGPRRFEDHNLE
jgi:hypothetical protein